MSDPRVHAGLMILGIICLVAAGLIVISMFYGEWKKGKHDD